MVPHADLERNTADTPHGTNVEQAGAVTSKVVSMRHADAIT